MSFKVGDRVKIVKADGPSAKHLQHLVGKEATVKKVHANGTSYMLNIFVGYGDWWDENELELIKSKEEKGGKERVPGSRP